MCQWIRVEDDLPKIRDETFLTYAKTGFKTLLYYNKQQGWHKFGEYSISYWNDNVTHWQYVDLPEGIE